MAVMKKRWIDHHPYREEELKQLAVECQRAGASAMVTTLKDAVRIPEAWVKGWPIPLAVLHVNLQLLEEANFFDRLRSVLDR